jgi:serine/threonine protein kinase
VEDGTPFGRYRLLDLLGRGGMGEVWRAFDTVTERTVALKVLPTQFADDATYQERFRREARSAAGLDEPHVVPIYDFGEIDGRLYVTMRLIKGHDLHTILGQGRMEVARAVGIVGQVASALQAAHDIGLVHRDVKPSNILVGQDDFAYLIDFGIARAVGQTGLTSASGFVGTWAYMAPERVSSGQSDPRADVYALACVLYECLTGAPPFPGDSLEQQVGGHLAMPPPRASDRHRDIPPQLDAVVTKGMAKNPDERYGTTRELAQAAKSAITAPPTVPPRVAPPTAQAPIVNGYPQPPTQTGYPTNRPMFAQGPPPVAPSHHRPPTGPPPNWPGQPAPGWQPLPVPKPLAPKTSRNRVIAISAIAVIAIVAVVAGIVIANTGNQTATPTTSSSITTTTAEEVANSGPFTGTFTAEFGPVTFLNGLPPPPENAIPGFTETWNLRSGCGSNGCIATATSGGTYASKDVVFDQIDGTWLAVTTSKKTCQGFADDEAWNTITLQLQPDGTLTGEMTQVSTHSCGNKRTLKFTRTGDTDLSLLPDPAEQAARVISPAEALHGRYDMTTDFQTGTTRTQTATYTVRTDCLRDGDRCVSNFTNLTSNETFVFASGAWTRNSELDNPCPKGGTSHLVVSASLPLPQPPQNPIAMLNGHGFVESTGSACVGGGFDESFVRTGD